MWCATCTSSLESIAIEVLQCDQVAHIEFIEAIAVVDQEPLESVAYMTSLELILVYEM